MRAIRLALPRDLLMFIGPRWKRLNHAVDAGNRYALAREIQQLDAVAHQLFVAALPKWVMAMSGFLLADGNERREEIDNAFEIARDRKSTRLNSSHLGIS